MADIQCIIDAAFAAGGGIARLPAGEVVLASPLTLRNGVRLVGHGDATVLRRGYPGGAPMLDGKGVADCHIEDLAIDLDAGVGTAFPAGIGFQNDADGAQCRDVSVRRCRIYSSSAAPDNANVSGFDLVTVMGVLARGVNGLLVEDCRLERAQLKVAGPQAVGPGGGRNITVRGVYSVGAEEFGVSAVSPRLADRIEDIRILDCTFVEPRLGGVFIGGDGDSRELGTCRRIQVRGCTVLDAGESGIFIRAGRQSDDWQIVNNHIGWSQSLPGTSPIRLKGFDPRMGPDGEEVRSSVEGVSVVGNHVAGGEFAGLTISAQATECLVAQNRFYENRGIELRSSQGPIGSVSIVQNQCTRTARIVFARALAGNIGPILYEHNVGVDLARNDLLIQETSPYVVGFREPG